MSNDDIPDNKFWLALWSAGMTTVLGIAVTIATSSDRADQRRAELIKAGADPIVLECAESSGLDKKAAVCDKIKDGR